MEDYKRNQIEEALSRVFGEDSKEPSPDLRSRVKRLLDADRALGRNPRSSDPEKSTFAFYSVEPPGKGAEVRFSSYEAFAILTALRLMRHAWPQSFPVSVLRRVRSKLEQEHARILRQDPEILFDEKAIRARARPGDLAVDNTDPVFLVVVSGQKGSSADVAGLMLFDICRGLESVYKFVGQHAAEAWSLFELVTPAHYLEHHLAKTEPKKRGRGA